MSLLCCLFSLLLHFLLATSLSIFPSPQINHAADSVGTTAYDILEENGFPAGLLPSTVTDYDLDEDDGAFTLYLDSSCKVDIPNVYPIKFKSTITGDITYGKISSLKGVTVKVLFIWWTINSITVNDDALVFKVGPFSASYGISNFDENPTCVSGFRDLLSQVA
ncbi:hypothetical protein KP509_01G066900 [Ceratopteris richardii]|uniref:Uncharacterized protein n=1 Tax=Ceratopteris richardii TaxID=49495 RepID=A0A8T2VHC3_CERRI|nr:hypothetical protein KP509_01G066900 [Ceratopteris richardii]